MSGAAVAAPPRPAAQAVWIVNPVAGYGRAAGYEARLRREVPGAVVRRTTAVAEPERVAREAVRDGARTVVAVGGDGTLGEVVNGVLAEGWHDVTVGFVPAGTCCDFSRGRDISTSLSQLLDPARARPTDVGLARCQGPHGPVERRFLANCTMGLVPAIGERFVRKTRVSLALKRVSVQLAQAFYGVEAVLRFRPVRLSIHHDGVPLEAEATNLAVMKVPYFAGGLSFGESLVAPDDGRLHVALLGPASPAGVAGFIWKAFRHRLAGDPRLRSWTATTVRVDADHPMPVEVDGDLIGWTPAEFTVLPNRLQTIT